MNIFVHKAELIIIHCYKNKVIKLNYTKLYVSSREK